MRGWRWSESFAFGITYSTLVEDHLSGLAHPEPEQLRRDKDGEDAGVDEDIQKQHNGGNIAPARAPAALFLLVLKLVDFDAS